MQFTRQEYLRMLGNLQENNQLPKEYLEISFRDLDDAVLRTIFDALPDFLRDPFKPNWPAYDPVPGATMEGGVRNQ